MTHEFKQTIKENISFFSEDKIEGYNKDSGEITHIDSVFVRWEINFDVRQGGITNASVKILDFEFTAYQDDLQTYIGDDESDFHEGFKLLCNKESGFKADFGTDNFTFDNMVISEVVIDFKDGVVSFY